MQKKNRLLGVRKSLLIGQTFNNTNHSVHYRLVPEIKEDPLRATHQKIRSSTTNMDTKIKQGRSGSDYDTSQGAEEGIQSAVLVSFGHHVWPTVSQHV